jgi:hypothetical protein
MIRLFTGVLALLVYWVLGFLVEDIEAIRGPDYTQIEAQVVEADLIARQRALAEELEEINRSIADKQEEMRIVTDSSRNLQETINQLIELQKLAVQKGMPLPAEEQGNLSDSLAHFLRSQTQYQSHNAELSSLTERKRQRMGQLQETEARLEEQRRPARKEYQRLQKKHALRLASLQLLILLPLLAGGAYLVIARRGSIYFPLFLGYGIATLLKVAGVIHEYFPSRLFKYVLILSLLAAVVKLLISFIRTVAFPKAQWLTRQYREAYERFLCPVCEYPIRTGPRKYLYWTRRTVNKLVLPEASACEEEPYTCPCCGTGLFEECGSCHRVRHALLPTCQHCQAAKVISDGSQESVASVSA